MRTRLLLFIFVLAIASFAGATVAQQSEGVQMTMAGVTTHPSQGDVVTITEGSAMLLTTADGATMTFHTVGLEPNHVYTAWWAIINNPEACASSPCVGSDILGNTALVQAEVVYGDGIIVKDDGVGDFAGHLNSGDLPRGWMGNGFTNPLGAEIQIVINDHGPLIADDVSSMINSYRGGCTDESLPPPFPDTAKADGLPGPNTCRLIQTTIFQQ